MLKNFVFYFILSTLIFAQEIPYTYKGMQMILQAPFPLNKLIILDSGLRQFDDSTSNQVVFLNDEYS